MDHIYVPIQLNYLMVIKHYAKQSMILLIRLYEILIPINKQFKIIVNNPLNLHSMSFPLIKKINYLERSNSMFIYKKYNEKIR